MKVMNHTEEQQTENKTSLSNGAKRNRIFIYIAIAGVIAAVITAALLAIIFIRSVQKRRNRKNY